MARCSVAEGRDYIAKCKPTQIKTGAICLHVYIKSAFIAAPSPSSQTATFLKQCKVMKKMGCKREIISVRYLHDQKYNAYYEGETIICHECQTRIFSYSKVLTTRLLKNLTAKGTRQEEHDAKSVLSLDWTKFTEDHNEIVAKFVPKLHPEESYVHTIKTELEDRVV